MKRSPRYEREIARLYELVPPGSSIQSTGGILAHFIGRNRLIDFSGGLSAEAEYIIIPCHDVLSASAEREKLIKKAAAIDGIKMALITENENHEIFCFHLPYKKNKLSNLEKSAM